MKNLLLIAFGLIAFLGHSQADEIIGEKKEGVVFKYPEGSGGGFENPATATLNMSSFDVTGVDEIDAAIINIGTPLSELRALNIRGASSQARVFLEGTDASSNPGIEASIADNSKGIIRLTRTGTDGTKWQFYNEADGGVLTAKWEMVSDNLVSLTSGSITGISAVGSATSADLTKLNGITATSTELNYVDGVTSAIQTQLNAISDTDDQTAAEVTYSNATSGLTATTVQGGIDELASDINFDATYRTVTYGATVTDTYDEDQPNFRIVLAGNIDLGIGSITEGGGMVTLVRSGYGDTIDLETQSGVLTGNHTYSTTELAVRLTYYYENGSVMWYCNNCENSAGSGDVTKVGTPVDDEVMVWTGNGTAEGDPDLKWDGNSLTINSDNGTTSNLELTNSAGTYSELLFGSTNNGTNIGGLSYRDNAGSTRLAFYFQNNTVVLSNRATNGTVEIRANSTAGSGGEQSVALFEDDLINLKKNTDVTGNITVSGTVDGVDVAALSTTVGTKANSASPTLTGTVTMPSTFTIGANNFVRSGAHGLTLTTTGTTNVTLPTTGTLTTQSGTSTLTNKRITQRVTTIASSATPTPSGDASDMFTVTALATNATVAAPTGTPTSGQPLLIRIKDNGTSRTLAWNAIYRAGTDFDLPTATVISKTLYIQFIYNAADSKWDAVGLTRGF